MVSRKKNLLLGQLLQWSQGRNIYYSGSYFDGLKEENIYYSGIYFDGLMVEISIIRAATLMVSRYKYLLFGQLFRWSQGRNIYYWAAT